MVFFQIVEEVKTTSNKFGNRIQEWMKLSGKFEQTTGDSNTRLHQDFSKCRLDYVTRNPKEWITEIKLPRGYLKHFTYKLMTHK